MVFTGKTIKIIVFGSQGNNIPNFATKIEREMAGRNPLQTYPGNQHTVDGGNPANQLRLVVYPIIYRVFYIPGGAGFLPSSMKVQV